MPSDMSKQDPSGVLSEPAQQTREHSKLKLFAGVIVGEFFGTFLFLLVGFLIVLAANQSTPAAVGVEINVLQILAVSIGFGLLVFLVITLVAPLSGGALNPAVALCLMLTGKVSIVNGAFMVVVELVAGIVAAFCAKGLTDSPLKFATALSDSFTVYQGALLEALGTLVLCLAVLFTAPSQTRSPAVAPVAIGTALLVGHLFGVYGTGASFNPARALGPSVAAFRFPTYHWIYWIGPLLGSGLAAGIHTVFRFFDGV